MSFSCVMMCHSYGECWPTFIYMILKDLPKLQNHKNSVRITEYRKLGNQTREKANFVKSKT